MKKTLFILFIILSNLSYSMTKFAQNFQERKDILVEPISILNANDGYFIMDYFSGKLVYYNSEFELKKVYASLDRVKHVEYFNDYLYLSQSEINSILKINPHTGERKTFGKTGLRRGEFLHPGEIKGYNNKIYIIDENNYRIQYFDKNMNFIGQVDIPTASNFKNSLNLNYSMVLSEDRLYLLDINNKHLHVYKDLIYEQLIDLRNFSYPSKLYKINEEIYIYEKTKNQLINIEDNSYYDIDIDFNRNLVPLNSFDIDNKQNILFIKDFKVYSYSTQNKRSKLLKVLNQAKKEEYIKPVALDIYNDNLYVLDQVKNKILVYNPYGNFLREINFNLTNAIDFKIDENGDILIISSVENSLLKLNNNGKEMKKIKSYELLPFSKVDWLIENDIYYGVERGLDTNVYMTSLSINKEAALYYVLNNKTKRVDVYNAKLDRLKTLGRAESNWNIFFNRKGSNRFSRDPVYYNSLKDIFYYNNKIYVLDSFYNRIFILDERGIEDYFEDDFNALNSIYIENGIISVVDKNNFRLLQYNLDFDLINEVNFAQNSYQPIKIFKNYLIVREYTREYREKYKILKLSDSTLINEI